MHTITSRDGTPIAYWRSGQGPPLLLVHGATADHTTTWRFVLPELARKFTVCAMDRRGRGGSGDSSSYDLMREADDVAAVIESIGRPVNVLGHSHGALCALEAALLTTNVHRLVLYEGVPLCGADDFNPGVVDRLEALLEAGDVEGVLMGLLRDVLEMPVHEIEQLRSSAESWRTRLANVRTTPRELRAYERYSFASERFQTLCTPTLLLVGGESPPRELASAERVAAALPNARIAVLAGQQHIAMYTTPEAFVDEVVRFLDDA